MSALDLSPEKVVQVAIGMDYPNYSENRSIRLCLSRVLRTKTSSGSDISVRDGKGSAMAG